MPEGLPISPAQCRAARGLLAWSQRDLATEAKIASKTITRFESTEGPMRSGATPHMLRHAFERAGVRFTGSDGVAFRRAS